MLERIEINSAFERIEFDPELPVDLAQITYKGIDRTRIKPNCFRDRHTAYPETLMPTTSFLPDNSLTVVPKILPGVQTVYSNRRLKYGKVTLPIPDGFFFGHNDDDQQHYRTTQSRRWLGNVPNDIHINIVVGGIIELNCDRFRKSDLTFSLRNKNVKAKDIENVLGFLVDQHCALQELENMDALKSTVGRRPSHEYQVLWGQSQFFLPKISEENSRRINSELIRIE